jgi:hypothetical protein
VSSPNAAGRKTIRSIGVPWELARAAAKAVR